MDTRKILNEGIDVCTDLHALREKMKEKVILFGCGNIGNEAFEYFGKELIYCFADNNKKWNNRIFNGKTVITFDKLKKDYRDFFIVITTNDVNAYAITRQLEENGILDCIIFSELKNAKQFKKMDPLTLLQLFSKDYSQVDFQMRYYKNQLEETENQLDYLLSHVDITTIKPARGYLRKRQIETVHFAREVLNVFEPFNIKPFLYAGNLLGLIRHNGFVPWDDDIDFGLFREEYNKLIEVCKTRYYVAEYDGNNKDVLVWVNKKTLEHPDEYILLVYHNQIQISKGTSIIDRLCVDFFAFDFYNENYCFEEHKKIVISLEQELENRTTEKEKIQLIHEKIQKYDEIVLESDYVYFGLDNMDSFKKKFNKQWIDKRTILPLKQVMFENEMFFTPNDPEKMLEYEYENYTQFPEKFGIATHDYWSLFKQKYILNIEFYLVDAFEISHFKPFYYFLRKHGIYALFVAEKCEINTVGDWFDYQKAIDILENEGLEYHTKCNSNADFVFTTQDVYVLRKYKGAKKINMSYGFGLNKNSYAHSNRTVEGFDYRFVHGEFSKHQLKTQFPENKLYIMGFPKHYYLNEDNHDRMNILTKLYINTSKKIIMYLPTWDEDSSILMYMQAFMKLKQKYFIVTKPHHVTWRNPEKAEELKALYEMSDLVLNCNYDFDEVCFLGDIMICDAKSGASLEAMLVNQNIKMILLSVQLDLKEYFFDEIFDLAHILNNSDILCDTIEEVLKVDKYQTNRACHISTLLGDKENNYLDKIYKEVFEKK